MRTAQRLLFAGSWVTVLLVGGCRIDPYNFGTDASWPPIPDASLVDAGGDGGDAETCTPSPEVCDGTDNDCDGVVDNAGATVVASDPFNCGECGNACSYPSASATCIGGGCAMGPCNPNYWDLNEDDNDGCEHQCYLRNNGVEVCNGFDDDCDGDVDEDFDLMNDVDSCGQCYRACSFFQGEGACVNGQCELSGCKDGYVDKDGNANNGCECLMGVVESTTTCDATNPCGAGEVCADVNNDSVSHCGPIPQDVCDGLDNDCDGVVDEDAPAQLGTDPCYTHPVGCTADASGVYACAGTCQTGISTCVGGGVVCGNQIPPSAEICDNLDNDCNGVVDDGYDKQNDPANCGSCGNQCSLSNAVPACVTGQCMISACLPNTWNLNGADSDGCEYSCTISNGGVEACGDSVDNDCDGQVDEGFDFQNDANNCGTCGYNCTTVKPFGTQVAGCAGGACQFSCQADYYDLNADLAQGESGNGCEYFCVQTGGGVETCDGVDNDCNGVVDDGFNLNNDVTNCGGCGNACAASTGANSQVDGCTNGICQYSCLTGFVDLNGDVSLGGVGNGCEYTCAVTNGGTEMCDGVDNDCDGDTDEAPGGGVLTQACYTGAAATENVGPCHGGTQTCSGGGWGTCQGEVVPGVETCDGVDNDCDNSTDEDGGGAPLAQACYTGPVSTENVGPCHGGTQTCSGGAYSACTGQVTPAQETCDGADNDCDSSVDEDFDITTDLANCGGCGVSCATTAGASSYPTACAAGVCQYACSPDHYDLDGDIANGLSGTGCEYTCVLTNGGVEACGDGVDNDCDNQIDEGFDLQNDPNNCSACGYVCATHEGPNSGQTGCVAGVCQFTCDVGFYDLNGDVASGDTGNGCEYACAITNGGVEACDGADNDCDGPVDEDFDLQIDATNCGSCGYDCAAHVGPNSTAAGCVGGACQYVCNVGFHDLNGNVGAGDNGDGCEHTCTVTNSGVEICDGLDNDCDGQTDEDGSGQPLSQVCYTPGYGAATGCTAPGACVGFCQEGTQTCVGGVLGECTGEINPQAELCDGADNDCDLAVDEDFDASTDVNNCGACGQSCWAVPPTDSYPTSCVAGACVYACVQGFGDVNGDLNDVVTDGCEYTCPVNPPSAEFCDGQDNDCDGQTDEGLTPPAICYQGIDGPGPALPGSDENNPCFGTVALCVDPDGAGGLSHGWYCQYPSAVDVDAGNPNSILGVESTCDGSDNDCDGIPDDEFAIGQTCYAGVGDCRQAGELVCTSDELAAECDAVPGAPGSELCDGLDNDCDGEVDEADPADLGFSGYGAFVYIAAGDFTIFAHEASRPSADATSGGFGDSGVPCSVPGVMPWSGLTAVDQVPLGEVVVRDVCLRLGPGWDLCTDVQWYRACADGPLPSGGEEFPYGTPYESLTCNGYDYGVSEGAVQPRPTGALAQCERSFGGDAIYDLGGNLKEYVLSGPDYELRGGAYNNVSQGGGAPALQCDGVIPVDPDPEIHLPSVGFRCCYSGDLFN